MLILELSQLSQFKPKCMLVICQICFHHVLPTFWRPSKHPFDVPNWCHLCPRGLAVEVVGGPVVGDQKFRGAAR